MSIINLLEQIRADDIVLPAIQRDFVWSEDKIEKLLDSIMRSYPIGIVLLWETYERIQYRHFVRHYRGEALSTFSENTRKRKLRLVLDGQQRLQSLYIGLFGAHEGRPLYFDVLSGVGSDDFQEEKFVFSFLKPKEAKDQNRKVVSQIKDHDDTEQGMALEKSFFVKMQDVLAMSRRELQEFQALTPKKFGLSRDEELRLQTNLATLRDSLTNEENILKTTIIDANRPKLSRDRKSESEVLEAFVRINREGMPLSRSDLIFSMLKLKWKESAENLPQFVHSVNKGNAFEIDTDFVVRCLFVVSGLGSRFDVDSLRKQSSVEKIQKNFSTCCNAIRSTIDFVQKECGIASSKLLGGYYNLVPLVYYLFHTPNHQVPDSEIDNVRRAVLLLGFTSPFSRYADSRLNKFIRNAFGDIASNSDFPSDAVWWWVLNWEGISVFGAKVLQSNILLTLHLLQRQSGTNIHYEANLPQVDHIFPRSILREKEFDEAEVNHFANFWILEKGKNQNKSNTHPKKYFEGVSKGVRSKAFIKLDYLDYRKYRTFLKWREEKIIKHLRSQLRFSKKEFDSLSYLGLS